MSDSTQHKEELTSRRLYLRLLTYVRPYWRAFALALLCMGLSSIVEPAFPALMKYLLDDGFSKASGTWDWLIYPVAIVGIFVSRALLGIIGDYLMSWVSNHVVMELREQMFAKLLQLPTRYFSDNLSGRVMSKVAYDVGGVAGAATGALTVLVKDSLSIIGLLAWLLYLNWKLTLITFAMTPFIAYSVRHFGGRLRRVARGQQESQGTITQVLQEAIEGQKVVKIFGGQDNEIARFHKAVQEQRRFNMRATIAAAAQGPIVQFFAALALGTIIGVALKQSAAAEGTIGGFVSFITAMLMVLAPLKRLTDVNAPIQRGLAAAESVFGTIDEVQEPDAGTTRLERAQGRIEFDGVCFAYPGVDKQVLDQVSFAINPGECVALVGPSGSGKTTMAGLLPRFYEPVAGEIRLDGVPIQNIALKDLRRQIALVSQDVVLFNDTISENIAYGQGEVDMQRIHEAARSAYAFDFIMELPEGFDTLIGENGVKLSGGQRQRIAIARAIYKNAPILILDEATSALDSESERYVQAALESLMQGRSTLVIAHRLSTIERADRIQVMANGKIQESGTHAELLAHDGLYARLSQLQMIEQ